LLSRDRSPSGRPRLRGAAPIRSEFRQPRESGCHSVDDRGRELRPPIELLARIDRTRDLIYVDDGSVWAPGRAPYLQVGSIPEIPLPLLLREALARAAVPADRPYLSEAMLHYESVLSSMVPKQAPQISHHERAGMRAA